MKTRKLSRKLIVSGLFVLLSFQIFSQKLTFEKIGVKSGLPSSEVYHVFEDKQGYIWFFTEYGIVKFNGSRMIPVCTNLSVDKSAVYAVTESPGGNIYFVNSKSTLYRIDHDKAYRVRGKALNTLYSRLDKAGALVVGINFETNGNLWLSYRHGCERYSSKEYYTPKLPLESKVKKGKRTVFLKLSHDPKKDRVYGSKYLWVNGEVISSDKSISAGFLKGLTSGYNCNGRNNTVVGRNGVYVQPFGGIILGRKFNEYRKVKVDIGYEIFSLNASPDGHIWAGTGRGLLEFDENLNYIGKYLENQIVSDIVFDRNNGLWVSTIGQGVFHCRNIHQLSYHNLIRNDEHISLLKTIDNSLFIGTYSGKLFVENSNKYKEIEVSRDVVVINDILKKDNIYYLATNSGLREFSENRPMTKAYKKISYSCNAVADYEVDKIYFVSGLFTGIFNVRTRELVFFKELQKTRGAVVRYNGDVIVSIKRGARIIRKGRFLSAEYLKPLREIAIAKITTDLNQNIWFCAKEKGLYFLDRNDEIHHIKVSPSTVVKNACFLESGAVVLATSKGTFVCKYSEIGNEISWKKIIQEEVLTIKEYNHKVYFGCKSGLFSMDVSKLFLPIKQSFYLRVIRTTKDTLKQFNTLQLKRDQNELFFDYDYLDFDQTTRTIHYRLKGPITEMSQVNGTQIHLQNLDPGDYTLEVYPVTRNGEKKKIIQRFTILPAYWETITFQIIIFLIGSLLILLIYRYFTNRRLKQKKAKDDVEKLLAEYRLTALKAQVNPHFMSNSLVAIQNLILQNETDKANLYLAKFSLLIRSLLEYSSKSYSSLKNEINMLELYVELEQLRFSDSFQYVLDIEPDFDLEETIIPTLITQPFVENAIWHGLLPLRDLINAKLILKIAMIGNDLRISIIDNRVGRGHYHGPKKKHHSKGTELIVNRIETLNKLYQTTGGKIEILDLSDEKDQPIGTQVNILIPELILKELYENK